MGYLCQHWLYGRRHIIPSRNARVSRKKYSKHSHVFPKISKTISLYYNIIYYIHLNYRYIHIYIYFIFRLNSHVMTTMSIDCGATDVDGYLDELMMIDTNGDEPMDNYSVVRLVLASGTLRAVLPNAPKGWCRRFARREGSSRRNQADSGPHRFVFRRLTRAPRPETAWPPQLSFSPTSWSENAWRPVAASGHQTSICRDTADTSLNTRGHFLFVGLPVNYMWTEILGYRHEPSLLFGSNTFWY